MSWTEIAGVLGTFVTIIGAMTALLTRSISTTRSELRDRMDSSQKQTCIKLESISSEIKDIKGTLKEKVDLGVCLAVRSGCDKNMVQWRKESEDDRKELWENLSSHSHSGLPLDSRVTRKA